jgi:hypothetical protein
MEVIKMSKNQEEFENQPKEKEVIKKDEVGSLEDVLGTDFLDK